MIPIKEQVKAAAEVVRAGWFAADAKHDELPEVIITTGSGLGAITDAVSVIFEISYNDIPQLPAAGAEGHAGRLLLGYLGNDVANASAGTKVVVLDGRVHGYEGHEPLTQALPLLIANELCGGARLAIFTSAVGAINADYHVGELVLIKDHINFSGETLVSLDANSDFGGDNLDMSFAYTPSYRERVQRIAAASSPLHEGVYIGCKGAMFETPAEIRAFRIWGADVVGMSTIHEVVAASRLGIAVLAISVVTNMAAGMEAKQLTLEEVLTNTSAAAGELAHLLSKLLSGQPG